MVELLVPPEPSQLSAVDEDPVRFDTELRPALMMTAIEELQDAGIDADVWKIEGIDSRQECEALAARARSGGRDNVGCVVLGRGADDSTVETWLKQTAGVPGYIGFAVGRTIWWDPVRNYLNQVNDRERSVQEISDRYRHFIAVYASAG
jgi:myo-inositol catabolism protein IolC